MVLGCGSNVVDKFFRVRALPKPGEKGYFESPTKIVEDSVVGGVTVNHLAWAKMLGVPTGLLALQGNDSSGKMIRKQMESMGLSTQFIEVDDSYTTAESYVMLQTDGERSIIMASGATSLIDDVVGTRLSKNFSGVCESSIFTTEISQVPLSGVITLLEAAKKCNNITVLDVDVTPTTAFEEAKLGNVEELKRCIELSDVLKPSHIAAAELITILTGAAPDASLSLSEVTRMLLLASNAKLVALTSGAEGCVIASISSTGNVQTVCVPPFQIESVLDATGAGDAFLGGLISGLYYHLQRGTSIPELEETQLFELAKVANAAGAACCRVLGGLPDRSTSRSFVAELEGFANTIISSQEPASETGLDSLSGSGSPVAAASIQSDCNAVCFSTSDIDTQQIAFAAQSLASAVSCGGRIFVTGVGKSGYVARRLAASLASISYHAHFVSASEWAHGDLGVLSCSSGLQTKDAVVVFSHSGNTAECVQAVQLIKHRCQQEASSEVSVVAVTSNCDSRLAQMSNHILLYSLPESSSEPLGGVPTTSIVLQEVVSNALIHECISQGLNSSETSSMQGVFKANHPGGTLGKTL
eukprot:CAMPEP_0175128752 /NCGR_PEP_ID=MMETSP0087-20121206/5101_1 /TAXON_ID=136419 /ORGANISM="Unknown Unknown, Strain D1" /LENGTH=584 /DNA_ID=CAMNT_0016410845 /DNA_START=47 /DNA_END=1801 /DNA_ORIENTATION=+